MLKRRDKSKKVCFLYIEDLSPANKLKFTNGKLDFWDLDIRMFRGDRRSIEYIYLNRGYHVVLVAPNKTRLLVFNR